MLSNGAAQSEAGSRANSALAASARLVRRYSQVSSAGPAVQPQPETEGETDSNMPPGGYFPEKDVADVGASPLHIAAGQGDRATIKTLLQSFSIDVLDKMGRTPLMYACIANKVKAVELLCKTGAVAQTCDVNGRTSLLWAAYYGHQDILRTLLKLDKGLIAVIDSDGRSAIHWSVKHPNARFEQKKGES